MAARDSFEQPDQDSQIPELERIGSLGGMDAAELAGLSQTTQDSEPAGDFEDDSSVLPDPEPIVIEALRPEISLEQFAPPSEEVIQEIKTAYEIMELIDNADFESAVNKINGLTHPGMITPLLDKLVKVIQEEYHIDDSYDYLTSYTNLLNMIAMAKSPDVRLRLAEAATEGHMRVLLDDYKNGELPLTELEILSYTISSDKLREGLIIDAMENSDYPTAEYLCNNHLGKYYSKEKVGAKLKTLSRNGGDIDFQDNANREKLR